MATSSSARSRLPSRRELPRLACSLARDPGELAGHFAVRHQVFVQTQGIFEHDDRDAHDEDPARTLHAVGVAGEDILGAVRLYPLGREGTWKGDRLAVLPAGRVMQLGALLVRFAVDTAGERGGRRMVAQIQVPNVGFFERLGWRADGEVAPLFGVAHQPMAIELRAER